MRTEEKKKLCSNCDGSIPREVAFCPYCGSVQSEDNEANLFSSPYSPPYSAQTSLFNEEERKEPMARKSEYKEADKKGAQQNFGLSNALPNIPEEQETEQVSGSIFWPTLFLCVGSNLLVLGFLQLFFSDNGFLRLEWNSSYWFIYCLISVPLLFFGFKKATRLSA